MEITLELVQMSTSEIVFILGAPRSGTTFLASLLKKTRYGAPFETHFITKYYKKLDEFGNLGQLTNFRKLMKAILSERPVMQWNLSIDIEKFFHQLNGNVEYSNIINQLCLLRNKERGFYAWGDKTPHYIAEIDVIYSLFPNAKFLHIIRDGRDVALSLLERNWGPNNLYSAARYWRKLNEENELIGALQNEGKLYSLRYEDLLDETEEHVKNIYSFLNTDISSDSVASLCSKVKKQNKNKWEKKLTANEIKTFENVASNTLSRLGYKTSHPQNPINTFRHYYFSIQDKLFWLKFMFKVNVVDGIKIRLFGKAPFAE